MNQSADVSYHEENAHECYARGYHGSYQYHVEMSDMLKERVTFYKRYPTRRGRKSARKEGIRVGKWY